ncbi:DNA polymerase III subunit delta [Candidatus Marinamargulisbacteria bacterium SCGC AAA071-K20]|nr:DNA polymerase III subunit delta [Candidatus Marinamargulisbacteria bacterium SCGC AAA071-K20]
MSEIKLFFGSEAFLVEEESRTGLLKLPGEDATFEGHFEWSSLQDALNLSSLFSSQKKIVIKNPWFFTKTLSDKDCAHLSEALESMSRSEHPVVIVNSGTIDQRKKPFKLVKPKASLSQFDPFKDWELEKVQSWLSNRARTQGLILDSDAVWALTEHCGTHLRQLAGELDKLSVYIGERKKIQLADVKAVCLGPQGSIFEFTESLKKRDQKATLKHLHRLFSHSEDPIKLHGLITASIRLYLQCLTGLQQGLNHQGLGKALGKHPFFLQKLIPDVKRHYSIADLTQSLQVLAACDVNIKSGKLLPKTAVELAINAIVCRS